MRTRVQAAQAVTSRGPLRKLARRSDAERFVDVDGTEQRTDRCDTEPVKAKWKSALGFMPPTFAGARGRRQRWARARGAHRTEDSGRRRDPSKGAKARTSPQ